MQVAGGGERRKEHGAWTKGGEGPRECGEERSHLFWTKEDTGGRIKGEGGGTSNKRPGI